MENSKETGVGTDPQDADAQLDKGEKMALKDLLEKRLNECGWRQNLEQMIRTTLDERGLKNVTHEQLAAEIVPQARAMVPANVRKEMLLRVRESLEAPLSSVKN